MQVLVIIGIRGLVRNIPEIIILVICYLLVIQEFSDQIALSVFLIIEIGCL